MSAPKFKKGQWTTVRVPMCAWNGVDVQIESVLEDDPGGDTGDEVSYMCRRSNFDMWPFKESELESWDDE